MTVKIEPSVDGDGQTPLSSADTQTCASDARAGAQTSEAAQTPPEAAQAPAVTAHSGAAQRPETQAPDASQAQVPDASQASETAARFTDFGLAEPILRAVTAMGYREPTPVQVKAIPVVMSGRDVMAAAQTGTGKTAGFALPIIHQLLPVASTSASPARHPVRALMLAPTRELADQIHENVRAYIKHTPLRAAVVFGGVDMQPQTQALRAGVEILTATPGRLLDHVQQRTVNLGQVQLLVLDEADRMLDMGFLPDIQRIINLLSPRRQNLMFSATFSEDIRKLARSFLNDPVTIEVARRNALAENVEQTVYRVDSVDHKRAAVAQLIRARKISQVIVFSNTKLGASRLARQLMQDGLNAEAIHGDRSQQERLQTLTAFKEGRVNVLVATDVAARGLDIVELPAVINFDLPHSPEDYVHRIGRTGRAGASGIALSLMTAHDERSLTDIEKLTRRHLTPEPLEVDEFHAFEVRSSSRPARGATHDAARGSERGSARGDGGRDQGRDDRRTTTAGRDRDRNHRSGERSPARAAAIADDPLFTRPYEEPSTPEPARLAAQSGQSGQEAKAGEEAATQAGLRNPKRQGRRLAVLLGGTPGS